MDSAVVKQLDALLNPKSIAVLGASNNPTKWGFGVINDLINKGYAGDIYPVTRSEETVSKLPAYKNLKDIPGPVDLAFIVVPSKYVPAAIQDCAEKGTKSAVIITAGFREMGEEGKKLEAEVLQIAREAGIRFVGPNCFGIVNTGCNISSMGLLSPYSMTHIPKGSIAIVSQSGNAGGYVLGLGYQRGLGFSKFVSSGNEADLGFEDYVEYLAADPDTDVIIGYVEGLKDGRRFLEIARETTRKKPIILLKVGRTKSGSRAAHSHTGSLAGSAAAYDAAFKQVGVICVDEVEDLLDVAGVVALQPMPRGNRVGIVTMGGGFGVIAVDAAEQRGLTVPQLTDETIQKISKWLPELWSHANPVDMIGTLDKTYACIGAVLKDENVDAVLAISSLGFPAGAALEGYPEEFREKALEYARQMEELELTQGVSGLVERVKSYGKPVIAGVGGGLPGAEEPRAVKELKKHGIMIYPTPERAAKILSYLVQYGDYLQSI
ncbi:MAG: CoA-binding protein [Chloroflexota bacterium]|nr:CoA-binding protein [Chloroflexota bacterium]